MHRAFVHDSVETDVRCDVGIGNEVLGFCRPNAERLDFADGAGKDVIADPKFAGPEFASVACQGGVRC